MLTLVEPLYVRAWLAAVRRIQDGVPKGDLAIQWDLAAEFSMLEGVRTAPRRWWFDDDQPLMEGLMGRVLELAEAVDEGVELGFHLCYGDLGHRHFVEPRGTELLVEVGNRLL